jgi:hypothetical protein
MYKINYFFAAVYQSIKSRRPDGTPYFNLCLGITGSVLLNVVNVLLILKIWFHTNLMSSSEGTFIAYFLSLSIIIMLLLRVLIPIDAVRDIEVKPKDIKRMGLFFISCFMLSVVFMVVLLILSRPDTLQH